MILYEFSYIISNSKNIIIIENRLYFECNIKLIFLNVQKNLI